MIGPRENRIQAAGCSAASTATKETTTSRAVPQPLSGRPGVRRRHTTAVPRCLARPAGTTSASGLGHSLPGVRPAGCPGFSRWYGAARRHRGLTRKWDLSRARGSVQARDLIAAGFGQWAAAISDGLRRLHAAGHLPDGTDPDDLAVTLLAALQGGLLLAHVQRDTRPLETAVDTLLGRARISRRDVPAAQETSAT